MNGNGSWWIELLKSVGVPGAVSAYLIYWLTAVLDRKLDMLILSIQQLTEAVKQMAK